MPPPPIPPPPMPPRPKASSGMTLIAAAAKRMLVKRIARIVLIDRFMAYSFPHHPDIIYDERIAL
jgi:hypothetical protein